MKRIIVLLTGSVLIFSLVGCNNDFMSRYPRDQITKQNFWHTVNDLRLYVNQFYPEFFVGFGDVWGVAEREPYGYTNNIAYADVITDNAAPYPYSKVAAGQYNDYITGSADCCGWNFSTIRDLNYFLVNYKRVTENIDQRNVYAGEVLFFKAWAYFKKVKTFGAVPWLNKPLKPNSPKLYPHRTPRTQVMDSVMTILNKAIKWLPATGSEQPGRISKDIALFLK